jgi:hypothetical protein
MKKLSLIIILLTMHLDLLACPVCEKQQPAVLKGITHGAGPQSDWEYVIVWCTIVIAAVSLFYTVKWILRPGEYESGHIKYTILNS